MKPSTPVPLAGQLSQGAVVVLSILFAFAIDAWWQERVERVEEGEVLATLHDDFTTNRAEVAGVLAAHTTMQDRFTRFLAMTPDDVRELEQDSLDAFQESFSGPYTFDAVRGTVDALVGAGRLALLENRELRYALTRFINLVDDSAEEAEQMSTVVAPVWETMASYGGPWMGTAYRPAFKEFLSAETFARMREDPMYVNRVRLFVSISNVYLSDVRRVADQIDTVVALLEGSG